jgi:hypothetical protein
MSRSAPSLHTHRPDPEWRGQAVVVAPAVRVAPVTPAVLSSTRMVDLDSGRPVHCGLLHAATEIFGDTGGEHWLRFIAPRTAANSAGGSAINATTVAVTGRQPTSEPGLSTLHVNSEFIVDDGGAADRRWGGRVQARGGGDADRGVSGGNHANDNHVGGANGGN